MNSRFSSTRLARLYQLLGSGVELWDIGCDHGWVGKAALQDKSFERVNFVDPSDVVIRNLLKTIGSDIPKQASFKILQQRADEIKLTQSSNTFLMAGFGGKQMLEGLRNIESQLHEKNHFVLSPHRDVFELRQKLIEMNWSLVSEEIHQEDDEFYSILVVTNAPGVPIHPFGSSQWKSPAGKAYCQHLLEILVHHRNVRDQKLREYLLTL